MAHPKAAGHQCGPGEDAKLTILDRIVTKLTVNLIVSLHIEGLFSLVKFIFLFGQEVIYNTLILFKSLLITVIFQKQ